MTKLTRKEQEPKLLTWIEILRDNKGQRTEEIDAARALPGYVVGTAPDHFWEKCQKSGVIPVKARFLSWAWLQELMWKIILGEKIVVVVMKEDEHYKIGPVILADLDKTLYTLLDEDWEAVGVSMREAKSNAILIVDGADSHQ